MSSPVVGKIRVLVLDEARAQAPRLQEALRAEEMHLTILAGGIDAAIKEAKELMPEVILLVPGRGAPADMVRRLDAAGVPCGPINRLDEVYADPQVQHRGLKIDVPHPLAGSVPLVANPIKFSRTPIAYDKPPPLVGEHADEVLRGLLGKSDAEIAALRDRKIV